MYTLAITGATGQFGRAVLSHLAGLIPADTCVVACTRNPDQCDSTGRIDEVRKADFADPKSLDGAFSGVDTLLLVSIEGDDDVRTRLHIQAFEAAACAGVRRIVYTSFFDVVADSPSVVARVHRLTEAAICQSGCAYTLLRNGPYVDNIALSVASAARRDGVFRMASGEARMPFIARADLALAAAHALVTDDVDNAVYRLSGAELLSYQQLCELVSVAVAAPVRHVTISDDAYRDELNAQGLSKALQARRIAYVQAMRQGFMTALTADFERLVGHAPQRMSAVIRELDLSPGRAAH